MSYQQVELYNVEGLLIDPEDHAIGFTRVPDGLRLVLNENARAYAPNLAIPLVPHAPTLPGRNLARLTTYAHLPILITLYSHLVSVPAYAKAQTRSPWTRRRIAAIWLRLTFPEQRVYESNTAPQHGVLLPVV
jgi:hypothetical protein